MLFVSCLFCHLSYKSKGGESTYGMYGDTVLMVVHRLGMLVPQIIEKGHHEIVQ